MRCKMTILNVLIACEESQRVCTEFRRLGHNAYSCDIVDCSGGHPEWHIKQDVIPLLNGRCTFKTCDGAVHKIDGKWDLIIAHPPCTYLSNAGTQCFSPKIKSYKEIYERMQMRSDAAIFFLKILLADCERIAVENPVGYMNTHYFPPNQIINPYEFCKNKADDDYVIKKTCLWLKGLPNLQRTNDFDKPTVNKYERENQQYAKYKYESWTEKTSGQKNRSKTFPGIAKAMAEQWSEYILNNMSN